MRPAGAKRGYSNLNLTYWVEPPRGGTRISSGIVGCIFPRLLQKFVMGTGLGFPDFYLHVRICRICLSVLFYLPTTIPQSSEMSNSGIDTIPQCANSAPLPINLKLLLLLGFPDGPDSVIHSPPSGLLPSFNSSLAITNNSTGT